MKFEKEIGGFPELIFSMKDCGYLKSYVDIVTLSDRSGLSGKLLRIITFFLHNKTNQMHQFPKFTGT